MGRFFSKLLLHRGELVLVWMKEDVLDGHFFHSPES